MNASNSPVVRAIVSITLPNDEQDAMRTSAFGFYRFDEITIGESCVIEVRHKTYRFTPQIINSFKAVENIDFISLE